VEVVPLVHVPRGGVQGAGVVGDAYDLDSWIIATGSPGAALRDAREVLWKSQLKEAEKDGGMGVERNIYLPCSTKNPRKRNFFSPGTVRPLPGGFAPLGSDTESQIVFALMTELNKNFGLQLDPFPSLECGVVTQADKSTANRYIVVGGSHMYRMAAYMPENTTSLAEPGFRAGPLTCGKVSQRLTELKPGNRDTVILDLLSNSSFMGTNEDSIPLWMMTMGDGSYHVPGSLIPTPMSIIRKTWQSCDCIAAAVKNSQIILFGPSPRYVSRRCCDDAEHLENYNSPDYESEILGGIDSINRTIEKWASEHGLNFTMIDPTEQSEPADFPLGERVTPDGSSWWSSSDPVHLSQGGYRVLASTVTRMQTSEEDVASQAGSCGSTTTGAGSSAHSSSGKRKQVDSFVVSAPQRGWREGFLSSQQYIKMSITGSIFLHSIACKKMWKLP
jgi:hypothetical protein